MSKPPASEREPAAPASEALLGRLHEHGAELVAVVSSDGRFTFVSPSLASAVGRPAAELLGAPAPSFVHPDDAGPLFRTLQAAASRTGAPLRAAARFRHADGSWRRTEGVATGHLDDPAVRGIVLNLLDVTAQRLAADRLARTRRLHEVLTRVNEAIVRVRDFPALARDVCRIAVEHGGFRMVWVGETDPGAGAVAPLAAWGQGHESYLEGLRIVPTNEPEGQGPTGVAIRTGRPLIIDDVESDPRMAPWRDRCLDHGYRSVAAFPVPPGGALNFYSGEPGIYDPEMVRLLDALAEDLSFARTSIAAERERAAAQEALRAREALLQLVLDTLPVGIWLAGPDGTITRGNRAGELLRASLGTAVESCDAALAVAVAREERTSARLVESVDGAGARRSVLLSAVPVRDGTGRTVGGLAVLEDVTERRRLEDQLRHAQKMEAIGRLAGGVAHDFNNLLTAILGYADVLLAREPEPLVREAADEIRAAGLRAAALTRQLLAFSRKQVLVPEVLDLNALVADLERMLRRLIGEHIRLETRLARGLGCVRADRGQLEQVIVNLVVNARDAMEGGGTLTIVTTEGAGDPSGLPEEAPEGAWIVLAIADTGTGMDAATLAHLFEPFFTTKEKGRGTGLGLATVYGIVRQSGGRIRVESEPGRGSRFEVWLPRVASAGIPAALEEEAAVPSHPAWGRVLVAEDDATVRRLVERTLERAGYRVLACDGPAAALALAENEEAFDLLLTDVVMPAMNGPELARRISVARPDLRVLYMSGYAGDALPEREMAGGRLLEKPFTSEALVEAVRSALRG